MCGAITMPQVLMILRGAPGAGKSTIAQNLVKSGLFHVYHEADHFFINSAGFYQFNPKKLPEAHAYCLSSAEDSLRQGKNVIVSNTGILEKHVEPYRDLATKYHCLLQEIIIPTTCFVSVHDVPQEKVERMRRVLQDELVNYYF